MRVKLRISRQTGSQINIRETQHKKEHVEMEIGERDSTTSQDARSPGSWTSQKGAPLPGTPRGSATPAFRLLAGRGEISGVLGPTVYAHFRRLPHETPRVAKSRWEQWGRPGAGSKPTQSIRAFPCGQGCRL